ncbi:MAG: hypothetical protein ABIA67_05460 [Candidatus Margulisiibacteriota bacterium]
MLKGKTVVCDSNINWDFNCYSKRHLMSQFAKTNNVYFVNPQVDLFKYLKRRKFSFFQRIRKTENLAIFDALALPFRGKSEMIRRLDPLYFSWQIKKLLKGVSQKDLILFIGNPAKVFLLDVFKDCACSIYHCSDNFPALFSGGLKQKIAGWEAELIKRASLVIAVSGGLLEKCRKMNPNSFLVEHGVDDRFLRPSEASVPRSQELEKISPPRMGYVGCIDSNVDFELLEFAVKSHGDKSFVFIGPVQPKKEDDFVRLKKYSNFWHLGVKNWQVLPEYVKNFDLCLIPWRIDDFTRYSSCPLKLREYIAAGKIVVSTAIPIEEGLKTAVKIARDKQEFSDLINIALSEAADPGRSQQISALARGCSWKDKAEEISGLVEKCLSCASATT